MKHFYTCILALFCLLPNRGNAQLNVVGYTNYILSGFNVLVQDVAFTNNSSLTNNAIDLLETKLIEISQFNIDPIKMDSLKAVPIFMDWNTTTGAAVYHPSEAWLIANGYIPEKARCVEISNITNFINWTNQNQPYMVMHELAHAYHHRVLDNNSSTITNAFNNAISNNLYTNVSYHTGGGNYINQPTAYALTNEFEYFAEITEAYFGLNDYFPFDYNDLINYDSVGFNAALFVWGDITLSIPTSNFNAIEASIFPNPTEGKLSLDIDQTNINRVNYEVVDIQGRVILTSESKTIETPIKLDMTSTPDGVYILKLFLDNRSKMFKIVKK
jgi:hypothetical protein